MYDTQTRTQQFVLLTGKPLFLSTMVSSYAQSAVKKSSLIYDTPSWQRSIVGVSCLEG